MSKIDLHTHTNASDGILEPELLIEKAKKIGLSAISITDHDQVGSIERGTVSGSKCGIEVIPGVELSCCWLEKNRKEFHILGYFIDYKNKKLLERLEYFQKIRTERAKKILELLWGLDYVGDWNYLISIAQGTIGMPHVVRTIFDNSKNKKQLINKFGKVPTISEFIREYMISGKPAYVEKAEFEPKEAIDLIHEVYGLAVLAHPCFDVQPGDKETFKVLKNWGIEGIETISPIETVEKTKEKIVYFSAIAKEFDFIITGGSDYHGIEGIGAGLGLAEWGMEINGEILEKLKEYYKIAGKGK